MLSISRFYISVQLHSASLFGGIDFATSQSLPALYIEENLSHTVKEKENQISAHREVAHREVAHREVAHREVAHAHSGVKHRSTRRWSVGGGQGGESHLHSLLESAAPALFPPQKGRYAMAGRVLRWFLSECQSAFVCGVWVVM